MRAIEQNFAVGFRYVVHFTTGAFDAQNPLLANALRASGLDGKLLFAIDSNVAARHTDLPARISRYAQAHNLPLGDDPPLIITGGEACKNDPGELQRVYAVINERGICRHSTIIVIGGGAVLDLVGYAAATAHRGIRLVRIPTTVLAQNDSAVGVKSGINAFGKKNFIGSFAPPTAVINDSQFLTTLEQRDWLAGIAEAVKVALIKDRDFFEWIERHSAALVARDLEAMQTLIHRCAELHCRHIASSGDPFESGSARPLDFGHWAAHRLETMTNFELRHGEAVAIGIALDAMYSHRIGSLPAADLQRILSCLRGVRLPLCHPAMREACEVLAGLEEFREHLGGRLTITLLRGLGQAFEVHDINRERMREAMSALLNAP